jgi:hypothetical protein
LTAAVGNALKSRPKQKNSCDRRVTRFPATYLTGFLRREAEKLEAAQVRRIIAALDEKCRDVEF